MVVYLSDKQVVMVRVSELGIEFLEKEIEFKEYMNMKEKEILELND